ncbi:MAG TPA: hypothetical protein VF498_09830 [Anaerolineales bacterium]
MSQIEGTIRCDNCGVEITWGPLTVNHYHYCCQDCFDGLACQCSQRALEEEESRTAELESSG